MLYVLLGSLDGRGRRSANLAILTSVLLPEDGFTDANLNHPWLSEAQDSMWGTAATVHRTAVDQTLDLNFQLEGVDASRKYRLRNLAIALG